MPALYTPRGVADDTSDVAALFAQLKEELHAAGPRGADVPPAQVRLSIRDQAERLWPVSAERPIVGKGGPLKSFLRRLMRWYVEPAFADQRAFNDAVLKLIDDLDERHSESSSRNEDRRLRAAGAVRARRGGADGRRPRRRAAGPRARGRARQRPVQVVPGHARPRPGVPLAARRPHRVRRPPDRPRDRDEVPGLLRPPSEQGRLGPAPVPAGLRLRPHRARPVRRVAGGPRDAPRGRAARHASRSARRGASSRPRATSPTGCSASTGSTPRSCRTRRRRSPIATPSPKASCSRSTGSTARSGSTC